MDFSPAFLKQISQRRTELRAEVAAILPAGSAIVLEVGCGHGHFLTRYASEFPEKICVGVDLRSDRIERARRKVARARLPNCHFVRAEALEFLQVLSSGIVFQEIWVLFPDPWPKKRHHKNRLLQPDFFENVAARSPENAHLYFRTDHAGYFEKVREIIPTLKTWRLGQDRGWPLEHETVFQARADSYQSLVAIRSLHPAKPTGKAAPGLPPPTDPK